MTNHAPLLPDEPYIDLTQNVIFDLVDIWGHIGRTERDGFLIKYEDISSLISVVIEEQMLRAIMRF